MIIYTLWAKSDAGELPYIIDAVDEYVVEETGDFPSVYQQRKDNPDVREVIITVPDNKIVALFTPPTIHGAIK